MEAAANCFIRDRLSSLSHWRAACRSLFRLVSCVVVTSIVTMDRKTKEVRVRNPAASGASEPPRVFTMDGVFDESLPQATVYEETCRPIVSNIIQGYNGQKTAQ